MSPANKSLPAPGDVDDTFYRYYSSRSKCTPEEFSEMIKSFCVEVEREVSELESSSKPPEIDFVNVYKMARSIKARSIVIGAKNLRAGCAFVLEAGLVFDEESLSDAVAGMRNEFKRTKENFETFLEMQNTIIEKEKQLGEPKK